MTPLVQPYLKVTIPWNQEGTIKKAQRWARRGKLPYKGSTKGFTLTAPLEVFYKLGFAQNGRASEDLSRVRQAGIKTQAARTLTFSDGSRVVEMLLDGDSQLASLVAKRLLGQQKNVMYTVYDRKGVGHTASHTLQWAERNPTKPRQRAAASEEVAQEPLPKSKLESLKKALKELWENSRDHFADALSDTPHDAAAVQEWMADLAGQELPYDQMLIWEGLESEEKSWVLEEAFKDLRTSPSNLNRSQYNHIYRGAAKKRLAALAGNLSPATLPSGNKITAVFDDLQEEPLEDPDDNEYRL